MTTRRGFLRAGAVAALATASAAATGRIAHALPGNTVAGTIAGTTLERVSVPGQPRVGGYRPLVDGAGWPLYVRQELATAGGISASVASRQSASQRSNIRGVIRYTEADW